MALTKYKTTMADTGSSEAMMMPKNEAILKIVVSEYQTLFVVKLATSGSCSWHKKLVHILSSFIQTQKQKSRETYSKVLSKSTMIQRRQSLTQPGWEMVFRLSWP